MDVLADRLRQLAYHRWANLAFVAALEEVPEPPASCVRWLAHLVASDSLWLDRILGRDQRLEVWPELEVSQSRREMARLFAEWDGYLASLTEEELARELEYVNTKGKPWKSTVGDVLSHLVTHGAHHRGQMAAALRDAGIDPPYTDFIHAVRTGAIPS